MAARQHPGIELPATRRANETVGILWTGKVMHGSRRMSIYDDRII